MSILHYVSCPPPELDSVDQPYDQGIGCYCVALSDGVVEHEAITISFQNVNPSIKRISIDFRLDSTNTNTALRLDILPRENKVIRNSRIESVWGTKETAVPEWLNLTYSTRFVFQVFFQSDGICIALNNRHMAIYKHRLPYNRIRNVQICTPAQDGVVERFLIDSYPYQYDCSMPHAQRLQNNCAIALRDLDVEPAAVSESRDSIGYYPTPSFINFKESIFDDGCSIYITGKIPLDARMIRVTLQVGNRIAPPPLIAMQMEIHFTGRTDEAHLITFRNFLNGEPCCEYDLLGSFNKIRAKRPIVLYIKREGNLFIIYANGERLHAFRLLINPIGVNTCTVDGDLRLATMGFSLNKFPIN